MTPVLYPAIDLLEGRAVRLHKGERETAKRYADDPVAQARAFVDQGARTLHVVDLDAAFGGARQLALIRRIADAVSPRPLQVGGGIRDLAAVEETLEAGAARAILGRRPWSGRRSPGARSRGSPPTASRCGIDVKDGRAATRGWTEAQGPTAAGLAAELAREGVRWLVVTAVSRDGTLEGFDLALLGEVARAAPEAHLIASGGAGELSHLRALARAGLTTLEGAIAGTALYERRFTIREAQAALEGAC